jgi:hypothetical protein
MKFRLSKSIASLICFTLMTVAIQSNATAWANRDLLNSEAGNNIEIDKPVTNGADGVDFITLTPNKPVEIPSEGESTQIKLGLRITNNSLVERTFLLIPGMPRFFSEDQQPLQLRKECAATRFAIPTLENFGAILRPGESIDVFDHVSIYQKNGEITIKYITTSELHCHFTGFSAGNYLVSINYKGIKDLSIKSEAIPWRKDVIAASNKLSLFMR